MTVPEFTHSVTIAAPAAKVYSLIADVEQTPRLSPTVVHIEQVEVTGDGDVIQRWVCEQGRMRTWLAGRQLDPAAGIILFDHRQPPPPVGEMHGKWSIQQSTAHETRVRLTHSWTLSTEDKEAATTFADRMQTGISKQLGGLKRFAERQQELDDLEYVDTHSVVMPGRIEDVFDAYWNLVGAPRKQEGDDFQVLAADAGEVCRVRVGTAKIAWKQLGELPPCHRSVRGVFTFHPVAGGIEVRTSRVAALDPDAVLRK
jgi:uncharacterized membrane protein